MRKGLFLLLLGLSVVGLADIPSQHWFKFHVIFEKGTEMHLYFWAVEYQIKLDSVNEEAYWKRSSHWRMADSLEVFRHWVVYQVQNKGDYVEEGEEFVQLLNPFWVSFDSLKFIKVLDQKTRQEGHIENPLNPADSVWFNAKALETWSTSVDRCSFVFWLYEDSPEMQEAMRKVKRLASVSDFEEEGKLIRFIQDQKGLKWVVLAFCYC